MKLSKAVAGTVAVTLLYLSGCKAGGEDPADVAEQFMDRYYNGANIVEAKALAVPALAEKIEATLQSSAAISESNDGTRKVAYTLKENLLGGTGTHSSAIYEIIIASKEGGSIRKRVHLSLDLVDGVWKIAEFNEGTF
ncbi:hypothetical protein MELA_02386 [Candidatus Methylomirabilis lanthanidiphila]|uniref:DUF4878 domain-containing protein n=1 Tax=Candidatus Methylomirabilis lanthanidiphila TaxID=2211376 RepID=A0A564ZMX6_9BACT|nr:hypothetical protein [Candidatus Methylomirabilis lanthanidiphila]VUZ85992.1 hypothetical protein MELA_02386 [Candidatus Methylomirabilis lanthanidiphila]